ncbi:T9SS type A sorting domain-containing protein [Lewinella sp. IMCC34183]|uniref:T9SS type A sorting domain-containing protein n=1 Tax=Lewinella sp. IMCC34183 TaxID=2248762 RepID=UPI000E283F4C|nr:T9SS type A sorting domain-containing protein [Lewinella sp. IMCC34183]
MRYYYRLLFFISVSPAVHGLTAQTTGSVTKTTSATYRYLLDPDADGFITESGAAFTSGTTEISEFEVIPGSVRGWSEMADVDETGSDVTPKCGNVDLVADDDGGGYGYYNIVDPTPGTPTSGDEYLLLRFRIGSDPGTANYGYNFLIDNDARFGGADPNTTCGNQGFEREIIYSTGGGTAGVSVYDVDGTTGRNSTTCNRCLTKNDVQYARAGSAGGCTTSTPTFITIPVPLAPLGIASNLAAADFYITMATSSAGNGTTILGGGNTKDYGGINQSGSLCNCTTGSACEIFDCRTQCINARFTGILPVDLTYFNAEATARDVRVRWATSAENNNDFFEVEHSRDGLRFLPLARLSSTGNADTPSEYDYVHADPAPGIHYYRLRQVDYDGSVTRSAVAVVAFGGTAPFDFALTPTVLRGGELRLERFGTKWSSRARVLIFDAMGRRVFDRAALPGRTLRLPVAELRPGNYIVQLRDGVHARARRFVKQ